MLSHRCRPSKGRLTAHAGRVDLGRARTDHEILLYQFHPWPVSATPIGRDGKGGAVDRFAVTAESPITETVVEEYDRNGGVCLRRAFDPQWVEEVKAGLDEVLGRRTGNLAPKPHDQPVGFNMHQFR